MANRPARQGDRYEEFIFGVRAPSVRYSFRIEHDRRFRDWRPFDEGHTFSFTTACLCPSRFQGREGKASIIPEPGYADHKLLDEGDVRRKWVGYIRATKAEFETVIYLPPQVCWPLGEAMASGNVRTMLANGLVETQGMYRAISFSFHGQEFDPTEYIG